MTRTLPRTAWFAGCGLVLVLGVLVAALGTEKGDSGPGPRPNALEAVWSRTVRGAPADGPEPAMGGTALAFPHGKRLTVVDARTGRIRARMSSTTDTFEEVGFAGDTLLALTERADGTRFLRGYDPDTGRELWNGEMGPGSSPVVQPGEYSESAILNPVVAPETGPPVLYREDGQVLGISPRNGSIRWQKAAPTDCAQEEYGSPFLVAATRKHVIRLNKCKGEPVTVEAVDPEDGSRVWLRKLGHSKMPIRLETVGNAAQVTLEDEYRIFAEDGEQLLRGKGSALLVGKRHGMVYLGEEAEHSRMRAVRAGTGKTAWRRPSVGWGELGSEVIAADWKTVERVAWDARRQAPGASDLTDFAGRRSPRLPWPVAGDFIGMSGKLLIVSSQAEGGTRYTALRPVHRPAEPGRPSALGGVAPREWPDACALLGRTYLSGLGRDYVELPVRPSRTVLGTRLPHPSVCRFARASGNDDDIFSVTVRWVAPTAEAARTYAESGVPWAIEHSGITEPRPGVRLYTTKIGLEQTPVANATVANGRWVLGVSTSGDKEHHRSLVRRVALHLSRLTAPGA